MTSTMIPLPKSGAAFGGATPVRRPGDFGPVVDEQSFADRFDRALTDARSRDDRVDSADSSNSTREAGTPKPSDDQDRAGELRHEPSRFEKNSRAHGSKNQDQSLEAGATPSDVKVGPSDQTDEDGDVTNHVAVSVAAALGLKSQPETAEVQGFSVLAGGSQAATEEPDTAVPILSAAQSEDVDIRIGDEATSGVHTDEPTDELGDTPSVQNQTDQQTTVPAGAARVSGPQPYEPSADVAVLPNSEPAQPQLEALNLDGEVAVSLAASSNDDDLESEDLAVTSESDAGFETLASDSDAVVTAGSQAGERSATSDPAQTSTTPITTAPTSPGTSVTSTSTSPPAANAPLVATGPIEVATNTNSATPIELGPNLVAVGSNAPPPSSAATSPLSTTQQSATMEAAISRIADTVEALSKQPPPRAISLDFGEAHGIRVRIAIDAGGINITVADAGAGTSDTANWQRQLSESFDHQQHNQEGQQTPGDNDAGITETRTSARQIRQDAGLRL